MNKQHRQAYYQLIESLHNCQNGEEQEILGANAETLFNLGILQQHAKQFDLA
ncbi:hypothetical protein LC612_04700 [Nostoc sp. CHAB 5834]|nr:hypothetical protein [Nostoc sp. CHAB 5834]